MAAFSMTGPIWEQAEWPVSQRIQKQTVIHSHNGMNKELLLSNKENAIHEPHEWIPQTSY